MVCRVFLLQMFVSNYCQTIVKLFYSNSRIFKLLSKQLFRLLNYCQNNFVNFWTIAKTISQTIDDTLNGPLVTLHQKLLENIQIIYKHINIPVLYCIYNQIYIYICISKPASFWCNWQMLPPLGQIQDLTKKSCSPLQCLKQLVLLRTTWHCSWRKQGPPQGRLVPGG